MHVHVHFPRTTPTPPRLIVWKRATVALIYYTKDFLALLSVTWKQKKMRLFGDSWLLGVALFVLRSPGIGSRVALIWPVSKPNQTNTTSAWIKTDSFFSLWDATAICIHHMPSEKWWLFSSPSPPIPPPLSTPYFPLLPPVVFFFFLCISWQIWDFVIQNCIEMFVMKPFLPTLFPTIPHFLTPVFICEPIWCVHFFGAK